MSSRTCVSFFFLTFSAQNPANVVKFPLDIFYGLNAVRVLSVVALLLAFASSIVTMVSDVRAVNKAQREPNSNNGTCGYVGCACSLPPHVLA